MTCSLHWWRGTGSGGWPVSLGASGNEKHDGWLSFHRYHRDEGSYWDIWLAIWYIYFFFLFLFIFFIYIPIYTYTYIHIHIHIYIYTHVYIYIYICMRVYIYIYVGICVMFFVVVTWVYATLYLLTAVASLSSESWWKATILLGIYQYEHAHFSSRCFKHISRNIFQIYWNVILKMFFAHICMMCWKTAICQHISCKVGQARTLIFCSQLPHNPTRLILNTPQKPWWM